MGLYRRNGVWWARWKEKGKRRYMSLRTRDEAAARAWWEGMRALLAAQYGDQPWHQALVARERGEVQPEPPKKPRTVAEAAEAWLRRVRVDHRGRETIRTYGLHARRWAKRWGALPLSALDRAKLETWREERLVAVSLRTVAHERAILAVFLKWCVKEGLLEAAPGVDSIKRVPKKRRRPASLEPAQLEHLLATCRGHAQPAIRALEPVVMLGAFAGLRRGELMALHWSDVDLAEGFLTVQPHGDWRPKSGELREVPLGPRLHAYLSELRARRPDAEHVCEGPTLRPWGVDALTRWARRLWKDAGLVTTGGPVIHSLRHTYATSLVRRGVDPETVKALLGHHSVTVTEVYFHSTRERQREAVSGF